MALPLPSSPLVQLARPVYHVGFLDVTLKVLRSVCFHCSRLRLDKADLKYKRALLIKNPKVSGREGGTQGGREGGKGGGKEGV